MKQFKKITLENGIPLYLLIDDNMKNIYCSYSVEYGHNGKWYNFNYDGKDYHALPGQAHYLEHVLSEHGKYGDVNVGFAARCHASNASTYTDVTTYEVKGYYDMGKSIEELIRTIDEPIFDDKDVEKSRNPILQEVIDDYESDQLYICNLIHRNLFSGFDLFDETLKPLGTIESTQQITADSLYTCYNAFYSDDRKYLIVAGPVDENEIVDFINGVYAKIKPHKSKLILPNIDYDPIRTAKDVFYKNVDIPLHGVGVKIKKPDNVQPKQFYFCLGALIQRMVDSRTFNNLMLDGIIRTYDNGFVNLTGDHLAFIQSYTTNSPAKCRDELIRVLKDGVATITKAEYERARKVLIASELREMEDKYEYLSKLPDTMNFSGEYSDSAYYQSIDYNTFMDTITQFDFSKMSEGTVRSLKK